MNKQCNLTLSIVVPVFNESESVAEMHRELVEVLEQIGEPYEIIFVDDGSTDNTFEELNKLSPATILRFSRNFGKSQALQAGFDRAQGTYIVTMDGDLQDDPHEIPKMLAKAREKVDLVCGWKKHRLDPFSKRFVSKIANGAARLMTGTHIHDMNCCLKVYHRDVVKQLTLYGDMHRYIPSLVVSLGYTVDEVTVNHRARKFGKTKYGIRRFVNSFFDFVTLIFLRRFTDRPLHFFGGIGTIVSGFGLAMLIYLTYLKLFLGATIGERPLLLLGVLLVIVGFQLLSLGLVGELVIRQQTDRRAFVIREVIER